MFGIFFSFQMFKLVINYKQCFYLVTKQLTPVCPQFLSVSQNILLH